MYFLSHILLQKFTFIACIVRSSVSPFVRSFYCVCVCVQYFVRYRFQFVVVTK